MPISGRSASFPHWILNDLTLFLIENRKETLLCQINPEEMIHATAEAAKSIKIVILVGLVIAGYALSGDSGQPDCPHGTVWSEAHQHCH